VDYLQRASTAGSDDRMLVATLRTDGAPAQMPGGYRPLPGAQPIMVASSTPTPTPSSVLPTVPHRTTIPVVRQQTPGQLAVEPPLRAPEREEADRQQEIVPVAVAESRPIRRSMPLPQDRPFDLGSIPGAGTPMERVNNGQAASGARPERQRVATVFFAPAEGFEAAFGASDPMRRLAPGAFDLRPHQRVARTSGPR
jgi:rare lipoprotein A